MVPRRQNTTKERRSHRIAAMFDRPSSSAGTHHGRPPAGPRRPSKDLYAEAAPHSPPKALRTNSGLTPTSNLPREGDGFGRSDHGQGSADCKFAGNDARHGYPDQAAAIPEERQVEDRDVGERGIEPQQFRRYPEESYQADRGYAMDYEERPHHQSRSDWTPQGVMKRIKKAFNPRPPRHGHGYAEPERKSHTKYEHSRPESTEQRLRRERNELEDKILQLKKDFDKQQLEKRRLQDDLTKEQSLAKSLRQSAKNMESMVENKELFLGPQAMDSVIQTKFEVLIKAIRTWATKFRAEADDFDGIMEKDFHIYHRIMPNCSTLNQLKDQLEKKKMGRLFIRGWAAYVMSHLLFRTSGTSAHDLWMDREVENHYFAVETHLYEELGGQISAREFNDWRAFSTHLLSKVSPKEPDKDALSAIEGAIKKVMDVVRSWVPEAEEDSVTDILHGIFVDAVKLSQFLRQQRACWHVQFPAKPLDDRGEVPGVSEPFWFNPFLMREYRGYDEGVDLDDLKQNLVAAVISPALVKRGDLNGQHFDKEYPVVRAEVAMVELK